MIKINVEIGGVHYCWPLDDVRKLYEDLKELFESKEMSAESVSRWPGWGNKWIHDRPSWKVDRSATDR